jgi:hypothetical protein
MKTHRPVRAGFLLLALVALGFCIPSHAADDRSKANPSPAATALTAEEKAALKVMDRWMARIDELRAKISDPTYQAMVEGNADALKQRLAALRKEFSQSVYEDLKFDAMIEHHRIAGWLAEPAVKPPAAPAARKEHPAEPKQSGR